MRKILSCAAVFAALFVFSGCEEYVTPVAVSRELVPITQDDVERERWLAERISEELPREFWENMERYSEVRLGLDEFLNRDQWPPNYPSYFGGMYWNDEGRLTVLIVEALAEEPDTLDFLAYIATLGGANIRFMEFSEMELRNAQDFIGDQNHPNLRFMYLDTMNNRINVHLLYGTDAHIAAFRRDVMDSPMLNITGMRGERLEFTIPAPPLRVQDSLGDVRFEVTETALLPYLVTVTFFNDSAYQIMTGYSYTVEAFDGEEWWVVPMMAAFRGAGLNVPPSGGTRDFLKNLRDAIGSLEPGLYRVRKDIACPHARPPVTEDDLHDFVAEFTIE
jgi:hypothetical protein